MSRSWNVGGTGPPEPARPITRVVVYLAAAGLLAPPAAVLNGSPLLRLGLSLILLVLVPPLVLCPLMTVTALVVLRRDGLASATLLLLTSPLWVLLLLVLGATDHAWNGLYTTAAVLWMLVIVLPLPVEIRAQRRRAAARVTPSAAWLS